MTIDPVGGIGVRAGLMWRRVTLALDRHRAWLLCGLSLLFFATTVPRARPTPFWHDEIYTLLLSRLPSARDIWSAARDGADLTPPLNVFLTRAAESIAGAGPVASRLPALLGFWVMSLVVFQIVRVRSNVIVACSAALLPWFTQGYRYSYEARGYGVMLALCALLFWSWSEAAAGRRRRLWLPVFALVCAATLWNHYFGAATFVPIACGELYRWAKRRAPDWPLWAAGAAGLALCAPLVTLILNASAAGATYWRHATWADIGASYWLLFHNTWAINPLALALIGVVVVFGLVRGGARLPTAIVAGHEVVAGIVAMSIPVLAVGMGRLTGAFTPRYALSGVVAAAVVVPLVLWWISRRSRVVEGVLLGVLAVNVAIDALGPPLVLRDPVVERPKLVEQLRASPVVVVAGPVQFLQLWYYAPADLRPRLWYVADPARSLRYLQRDTGDRGFIKLARWTPIGVRTYEQLMDQRSFELYDDGSGWLPAQLQDAGAIVTGSAAELGARVVHVVMPSGR
jgi:hypothetical protein